MSYAEDMGYDGYDAEEVAKAQLTQEVTLRGGNHYCADLCWAKDGE